MTLSETGADAAEPWGRAEFEERLRDVVERRYHHRHSFNVRMHEGELSPDEVRRWITNRFHYQRHIPVKDALIMSKLDTPELRRMWVRRVEQQDGRAAGGRTAGGRTADEGGIERWLRLGEAAGLDRAVLLAGRQVLPGVRFAVDGYVNFCRHRPALDAVAASLTELSAPDLMRRRTAAFERHYPWVRSSGLAYFRDRVHQGRQAGDEALRLVLDWARDRAGQDRAVAALAFKCEVLWSLLDAVDHASSPPSSEAGSPSPSSPPSPSMSSSPSSSSSPSPPSSPSPSGDAR
ncbi:pyrroloquinoline-quinone synthase PqqC [Streptomyces sp. NPDC101160]|uniref:pyrroloquinoline-quinone synthase PqqC n=1 Tax=Streptomyces sp. NPDC101160 TaxID=3366118 RepID=UPI00380B2AF5